MKPYTQLLHRLQTVTKRTWLIVGVVTLIVCVVGATALAYTLRQNSANKEAATVKTQQSTPSAPADSTAKQTEPAKVAVDEEKPQSTGQPAPAAPRTAPSTSPKTIAPPAPPAAVPAQEFRITSASLSSASVYCAGDYQVVQIGDVTLGVVGGGPGGTVSYGFEVTGGIPDELNGYRFSGTVPAGVTWTSFLKMKGGDSSYPQMVYAQTVYSGHGPAGVRAVVYTPNPVYSAWLTIPAHNSGQQC